MAHKVERGFTEHNFIPNKPICEPSLRPRPPLHSVAEIAEELGVTVGRLHAALSRPDAPPVRLISGIGHPRGKHRYVKAEVVRWYRTLTASHTPTEPPASA